MNIKFKDYNQQQNWLFPPSIEELIPESQTNRHKSLISICTLIGFAIMMILDVSLG